jgi:hypothetical protein
MTKTTPIPDSDQKRRLWTVAELLDAQFPEPVWAVPGIVPEGLTLIAGRPKVGKSWLMLQLAKAVSIGGMFLGQQVERGAVLYIALEDSPRRLQSRTMKIDIPRDAEIAFCNRIAPLQKGGLDELLVYMEDGYRLIVLDTLSRALPGVDLRNDQAEVSRVLDALQKLSINRGLAFGCIDHSRKPTGFNPDPVDDVKNSSEKTELADCVLTLYREQGKSGAVLKGRGRDMENVDLSLEWDGYTCTWINAGDTNDLKLTGARNEILDVLETIGKSQAVDVAKSIGKDRGNVFRTLQDLYAAGLITRETIGGKVYYEAS